jgi:hypothetical protein
MARFLFAILIAWCGNGDSNLWGQGLPEETLARLKAATVLVKVKGKSSEKSGSGFLLARRDAGGAVVTNAHVVRDVEGAGVRITCVFHSGTTNEHTVEADLVCVDEADDLAVLMVPNPKLPEPLDTATEVNVIETLPVYVLGFPFGEGLSTGKRHPSITVSPGAISSIRRDEREEVALLQLDGGINPGNSGGPIVSATGALVGISVAKLHSTEIGFAIPKPKLMKLLAGQLDSVKVLRAEFAPDHVEFYFEVALKDPLSNIREVVVLSTPKSATEARPAGEIEPAKCPIVEGMQVDTLTVETGIARGPVVRKRADGGERYLFQIRWTNRDGQVFYTAAAEIRTDRERFAMERPERKGPVDDGADGERPKGDRAEETQILLPATISRVLLGGAGRYLIAHLGIQSQAIVIDLTLGKQVLTLDAPADNLLAANSDLLLVISPYENRVNRWSFAEPKKSRTGQLPFPGEVRAVAMGHASAGPLLVFWVEGIEPLSNGYFSVVDPQSMRSELLSNPSARQRSGMPQSRHARDDVRLRAAANGSAFGVWVTSHSPMGVEVLFPGRFPLSVYSHTTMGYLLPMADGSGLCTSEGLLSIDLVRKRSTDPCIPGASPEYFLSISGHDIQVCRAADGSVVERITPTEKFFDATGLTPGPLPFDQRFHLIPQLNLLVLIPPSSDRLILAAVPLGGTGFSDRPDGKPSGRKRTAETDAEKKAKAAEERDEPFRTWTYDSGKFSVSARLEAVDKENVHLRTWDGRLITVALVLLKRTDRVYVDRFRSKTLMPDAKK